MGAIFVNLNPVLQQIHALGISENEPGLFVVAGDCTMPLSYGEQVAPKEQVRAVEFYSGIGGLHLALGRTRVSATIIRAFDWDQLACQVYEANYGPNIVQKVDISTLTATDLAVLDADMWLLSPSCQPYTVLNPLAKGAEDPRAKSFIHLMESVLPDLVALERHPKYMFVENVAGFESSSTRERLLHILHTHGYSTIEFLLTPLQFGIPNSRLRYYLLAKAKPLSFNSVHSSSDVVWRHIPGSGSEWLDHRDRADNASTDSVRELRDYLDDDSSTQDDSTISDRVLEKWGRLFDIVTPSGRRTCCFTRGYTKMAERSGSVLQMNEKLNTTVTFDKFLAAQKEGEPNAVRILDPLRLRYFSPSELLRIFCFGPCSKEGPLTFKWPNNISTKTKYKLIGNSVNVIVVSHLINYLLQ